MSQVTGIVKVYVNGTLQRSKEGAELDLGGKERTAQIAAGKVVGYSEKPMQSHLTATLAHMADTDLIDLGNLVDATLRFECDTGPVYMVSNAFTTKTVKLKGGEGEVSFEMEGEPAVEE